METKKEIYQEIKNQLKTLALEIRVVKNEIKKGMRENQLVYKLQWDLTSKRYEFRHRHIARCELRGRTRDEIEKPAENNKTNDAYIEQIKKDWTERINEAIRSNQERSVCTAESSAVGSCAG